MMLSSTGNFLSSRKMATKVDLYLKRADDFEEKARLPSDACVKTRYLELARAYRQLAKFIKACIASDDAGKLDGSYSAPKDEPRGPDIGPLSGEAAREAKTAERVGRKRRNQA